MTWNLTDPTRTLDRVLVVEGLAIWNYNYDRDRVVSFSHENHGQRWWHTEKGLFDASRMWVRHPDTGAPAELPAATRVTQTHHREDDPS